GATPARSPEPARQRQRAAGQRRPGADTVRGISFDWRAAVCVLAALAAARTGRKAGTALAAVFGARNAGGTGGPALGVDPRGGDVERQRRAEFAGGVERARFRAFARPRGSAGETFAPCAARDVGVGRRFDGVRAMALGTTFGDCV